MPAVVVGLGIVPLLVLAGVVFFELANWDKITPGVSALGTSIGGLSSSEAATHLTPGVQQQLDRPLDIHAPAVGATWRTTARDLGLRLDPNELSGAAYQIGRQGSPFDRLGEQLDVLTKGRSVSVASTTDRSALERSLASMARQLDKDPIDARLTLARDGAIQFSPAHEGLAVDVAASRDRLTVALNDGSPSVDLLTHPVPPKIPDQQLQVARDQLKRLLEPNVQPLTVKFSDRTWRLEHADMLKLLSLSGGTKPGQPAEVKIDDAPLQAWAARLSKEIDQAVQDARFAFNGGNLKVLRPSREGRSLDRDAMVKTVHDGLLAGELVLDVPVTVVSPAVSSDNPQALGITELIDRGSTSFAGSVAEKKANIALAAKKLNGHVVAPGATFSFNEAVGPTTLQAGFQWGFGITSGDNGPRTVPALAGGICQVATTLFHPVFWSGYYLEERHPHLYWIPAYTSRGVVGLDVTVDDDSGLDFKWTNTTREYVLIQADTDPEHIYFGLYGKKPSWKVEVDEAVITNRVPPDPKPIAEEAPTLPWGNTLVVEAARDGFDALVVRRVITGDASAARELPLKTAYQPSHNRTLVGTANKPAGANVDEAIQRVLDGQKPVEAKPSPTPASAPSDATPQPAQATPVPDKPAPTPTPAKRTDAKPTPKPTPKPNAASAPTAAPTR